MSAFGDKLRCPHCLEELDNLEDPKQLPCSHVFCSPCLEGLTKTEKESVKITCSICSKCHEVERLVDLPTPETSEHNSSEVINTDTSDDGNAGAKPEKRCDRCKEETTAVCYCVECDKSLCPRHEQAHQEFIGEDDEDHKLISIQTYLLKPNYYTKPKCARHKKEYAVSCKNCFRLRCKDCVEVSKCEGEVDHFYKTTQDIRSQLETEFADLTKALSDKMTKMCKLENETWQKLDNLELECGRLREEVQEKTNQMIREINRQQDECLARIEEYVKMKKTEVETKLLELRTRREFMEGLRYKSELLVRDNHVTNIINQREATVCQLKEVAGAKLEKWDQVDISLLEESLKVYLCRSRPQIPEKLELISSQSTGGKCYSTLLRKDGSLLVASHDGLCDYSRYGDGHSMVASVNNVISIAGSGLDHTYILDGKTRYRSSMVSIIKRPSYSTPLYPSYHRDGMLFSYNNSDLRYLSVSQKYIAVTTGRHSIVLYDMHKKTHAATRLAHNPVHLQFISDDHFVTTDGETVRMHYIESICLVWECKLLHGACGVSTTESGLIIFLSKGVLYIISAQGKFLKTLHNENIQESCGQISIHGDMLAVPYPKKEMFQLFRLK